ncbi:ATP-binding protein [soil metagenome]
MNLEPFFGGLPQPTLATPPTTRWFGDGLEIPPDAIARQDLDDLHLLYQALVDCYERWLDGRPDPDWADLARRIRHFDESPLREALERLGLGTLADPDAPLVLRRALHDLRGGAFFALRMYGTLLADETPTEDLVQPAVLLARDQAKLVRSLVPQIDPVGHRKDREEKAHGMKELVDKWEGFEFPGGDGGGDSRRRRPVMVEVGTLWRGTLAARCLEAAALDRVLYNMINNAARFTADGRVRLQVELVASSTVRIAVANAVAEEQGAWIEKETDGDASRLFLGGATRGGEGVGLQAAAAIVARAWGQVMPGEAVETGAVGARVRGGAFTAWIVWPALLGATPAEAG